MLLSLLMMAEPATALAQPSVTGVRVGQYGDMTRLVLDLTEATDFGLFTLARPNRVVIDLPPIGWALESRSLTIDRAAVAQLRFGQYRPDLARIVIDLNAPVTVRHAQVTPPRAGGAAPHRLVLDLRPVPQAAFLAKAGAPVEPAWIWQRAVRPVSKPTPREARALVNGVTRAAFLRPAPLPRRKPGAAPRSPRVIALDPGHGGRDPGAMSSADVAEKHLALTFGRELRAVLEASGRYRVVMTRNSDRYVGLRRRVAIARDAGADLFLSLHVDRLDDRAVGGASVYTLSDKASDAEAAELAARENKAGIVADVDFSEGYDPDVTRILISLVQQNTMNCSAVFVNLLLPELGRTTALIGRSHRFAGFRVLKAPDMPSVLIELGFLSNARDADRLSRKSHRVRLAGAILTALDKYFPERC